MLKMNYFIYSTKKDITPLPPTPSVIRFSQDSTSYIKSLEIVFQPILSQLSYFLYHGWWPAKGRGRPGRHAIWNNSITTETLITSTDLKETPQITYLWMENGWRLIFSCQTWMWLLPSLRIDCTRLYSCGNFHSDYFISLLSTYIFPLWCCFLCLCLPVIHVSMRGWVSPTAAAPVQSYCVFL